MADAWNWRKAGSVGKPLHCAGETMLFGKIFDTTGVLGMSGNAAQPDILGFPGWATIPS